MGLNMVPWCCGCAPAPSGRVFPAKGFRTEKMATAAAGLAPAKEVVEKKVELLKEVLSTSPYFHTSIFVSCSSPHKLPATVLRIRLVGERNNLPHGFGLVCADTGARGGDRGARQPESLPGQPLPLCLPPLLAVSIRCCEMVLVSNYQWLPLGCSPVIN
jgi:hypothetical protein